MFLAEIQQSYGQKRRVAQYVLPPKVFQVLPSEKFVGLHQITELFNINIYSILLFIKERELEPPEIIVLFFSHNTYLLPSYFCNCHKIRVRWNSETRASFEMGHIDYSIELYIKLQFIKHIVLAHP